jgi:gas vesicle protein
MRGLTRRQAAFSGSGQLLGSFLAGAVAGSAFALLYAPANGATTRLHLTEGARQGRSQVSGVVNRGLAAMQRGRARLSSAVEKGMKRGRMKWDGEDQAAIHPEGADR